MIVAGNLVVQLPLPNEVAFIRPVGEHPSSPIKARSGSNIRYRPNRCLLGFSMLHKNVKLSEWCVFTWWHLAIVLAAHVPWRASALAPHDRAEAANAAAVRRRWARSCHAGGLRHQRGTGSGTGSCAHDRSDRLGRIELVLSCSSYCHAVTALDSRSERAHLQISRKAPRICPTANFRADRRSDILDRKAKSQVARWIKTRGSP